MGVFEHFPYSNFHEMNIDWILGLLKKWEDIADNIKEMIDEAVEEGLSELNIEEIITNTLINYEFAINVKNPPEGLTPAKGDGTTDDTAAINGCVNYAAGLPNGGIVFFPQGLYLTDTVTLPSNVTLMGLSKHNVKLVKKSSANSTFIGGNGSNNAIYGITLDGNQASSTVQVNGFVGTPVDMEIRECDINNCGGRGVSWNGTNLTIDSVEFDSSGINCLLINGNGNVSVKNVLFKSLSEATGDGVIVVNSDNCDIDFRSVATCNQCLVLEGENNYVHCRITGATIPVTDNGSGNSVINVVGDYKIGADNLQINVGGDTTVNGQDVVINGTEHVDINGEDVVLNPKNPLTYKAPESYSKVFNSVRFKDGSTNYDVLVANEKTKLLESVYNVKMYGAKGDGVTDDTSAINLAIAAIGDSGSGGKLYFPKGTYLVSSKINLSGNTTVCGDGYDNTIIRLANNSNTSVIGCANDSNLRYYIEIRDIGIDGNCSGQTDGNCVEFYNVSESKIINCRISNPKNNAIFFGGDNSILIVLSNLILRGDENSTVGNGIYMESGTSDLVVTDIDAGWFTNGSGVLLSQCEGSSLMNVMAWQCQSCIKIYQGERTRISNCLADLSKQWGFVFLETDLVQAVNCQSRESGQIANNTYDGFYINGVSNNNAEKILLSNCVAYSSKSRSGLYIDTYSSNIKISNCDFTGNAIGIVNNGSDVDIDKASLMGYGNITNVDFSSSTVYTLNLEESGNDFINCYGTASASVSLIMPKNYSSHIVRNSTGETLTCSTAGDSSGAVIENNETKLVIYNGSQMVVVS